MAAWLSSRAETQAAWPRAAAMCSAVDPLDRFGLRTPERVGASMEAPALTSALTTATLPLIAARCSAVSPEPAACNPNHQIIS